MEARDFTGLHGVRAKFSGIGSRGGRLGWPSSTALNSCCICDSGFGESTIFFSIWDPSLEKYPHSEVGLGFKVLRLRKKWEQPRTSEEFRQPIRKQYP